MLRTLLSTSLSLSLLMGPLLLSGCDLLGSDDANTTRLETTGVFVANGGRLGDENGTITVYDPQNRNANTPSSLQLNAFVQSIALNDDRLYAQINTGFTAGRVNVIDASSYTNIAQSDSLGATRYVAFPKNDTTRAYVSTLRGSVHRFDPQTGALDEARATVGASASDLAATEEKVFATVPDTSLAFSDTLINNGSKLAVFDQGSPSTIRTIELGCDGPSSIALDEEDELVVVCTGRTVLNSEDPTDVRRRTDGAVVFVDPESESVLESDRISADVQFGTITGTQVAHYDPASEFLHAVSSRNREIVRVDTDANARTESISIPEESSLTGIAAAAYDGTTQRLYVARTDVQDPFRSAGTVVVLGSDRNEVDRFTAGPAPSHIAIRRQSR